MTSDPWAGVTPIGEKKAPERRTRVVVPEAPMVRTEAAAEDLAPSDPEAAAAEALEPVTVKELADKATVLMRRMFQAADDPARKAHERENFTRAFSVLMDRINALLTKPPQAAPIEMSDAQRHALLRLSTAVSQSCAARSDAP